MKSIAFHPLIDSWFAENLGSPTQVQNAAWPRIAAGEHLLITAPTGSGKTLTAFLWAINRFATGDLHTGSTRILYVSPLKALNNDIQRNLITPLAALKARFAENDEPFPDLRVQTRSGDTDGDERRRMLRHPPEILITTPESLNLLLSSAGGISLLQNIDTVILDEIHAVVGNKRGVYLMSAIERLVPLSGEFQRVALSATVNPLTTVAEFVAGFERVKDSYRKRSIGIIETPTQKTYDINVSYPDNAPSQGVDDSLWDRLVPDFVTHINRNKSTLLFVNSRALSEKITHKINNFAKKTIAYAHHGSLSKDIRSDVEKRLKEGSLSAIVATSTLEMGIDIGALDEVILIQSPDSIASTIQRIGRAGHDVGAVSHCTIYPTHPQDFIEAAVLSKAVLDADIEPITPIECPLDVLSQIIISITGTSSFDIDELFMEVRRSTPYHSLTRRQFDLVLNMLAGRYADNHIRELRPRVIVDRAENRIEARKGALLTLYLSGGVIPDRGYFQLRHEDNNARIGELDEEFVWEANIGKVFSLGTQHWQVKKITHNDVIVGVGKPAGIAPPFWKSEPLSRNFHYSERVASFLEHANESVSTDGFTEELIDEHRLESSVANEIVDYLKRQKAHTKADLPHRHHLLVEKIKTAPGGASGHQIVLHTMWGAMVNRPLAMALEAGWHQTFGEQPEIFVSNESLALQLPHDIRAEELFQLAPVDDIEALLRNRLEGSGFFGARFRENAGRALLLTKARFNERKPLWMSRLQSQKLLDAVLKYDDFPILLETWRTCLHDEFDLTSLRSLLRELESKAIQLSESSTETPSPFAQSIAWGQINSYMYMSDQPKSTKTSNLSTDLLSEVVFAPELRPDLPKAFVAEFEQRQHRCLPGYAPENSRDLVEWVKERSAIPENEWQRLLAHTDAHPMDDKIRPLSIDGATLMVALDDVTNIPDLLTKDLGTFLRNWLQYYGPIERSRIQSLLGVEPTNLTAALESLAEEGAVISGTLLEGDSNVYWCDVDNYEFLLRLLRNQHRASVEPLPTNRLVPFLYYWQTRHTSEDAVDRLFDVMTQMRGYVASAGAWESELLPARLPGYDTRDLDQLFQEGDLTWLGMGDKRVAFCFSEDTELLLEQTRPASAILPSDGGRYEFASLLDNNQANAKELHDSLWKETWQTQITNDSMSTLRKGLETSFSAPDASALGRRGKVRRGGFNQWRSAMPFTGNWFSVRQPRQSKDAVEVDELGRDRVRLLLDRYGILFRELVNREAEAFRWHTLFRSLRLMELSGEVISGYFFKNIAGPQFISPVALRTLQRMTNTDTIFWLNATDPISPCGLGLDGLESVPRRITSNYLVYHGNRLVMTVERQGKTLEFSVPPDTPELPQYLEVLRHILYRSFSPKRKLTVESINGVSAVKSDYLGQLDAAFDVAHDHKSVYLQREL